MARSKTFLVMKTNIGNFVQDYSSTLATQIGVWINDGYQDAWRRAMWTDLIDDNFTFESVIDQALYTFTTSMSITDFGEEVFVADVANGHALERFKIRDWWKKRSSSYSSDSLDSGNPVRYKILMEADSLQLDPPPTVAETYAMPYKKTVSDMSADTDVPGITTISLYLEEYGKSMALAYKKKYAQSTWWGNRAENTLRKLIKEEKVKYNQKYQRILSGYKMPRSHSLTGDSSYDSI